MGFSCEKQQRGTHHEGKKWVFECFHCFQCRLSVSDKRAKPVSLAVFSFSLPRRRNLYLRKTRQERRDFRLSMAETSAVHFNISVAMYCIYCWVVLFVGSMSDNGRLNVVMLKVNSWKPRNSQLCYPAPSAAQAGSSLACRQRQGAFADNRGRVSRRGGSKTFTRTSLTTWRA